MTYIVLWGLKILVSIVSLHVFGLDFLMMTMPLEKYKLSETSFKKKVGISTAVTPTQVLLLLSGVFVFKINCKRY